MPSSVVSLSSRSASSGNSWLEVKQNKSEQETIQGSTERPCAASTAPPEFSLRNLPGLRSPSSTESSASLMDAQSDQTVILPQLVKSPLTPISNHQIPTILDNGHGAGEPVQQLRQRKTHLGNNSDTASNQSHSSSPCKNSFSVKRTILTLFSCFRCCQRSTPTFDNVVDKRPEYDRSCNNFNY